MQDSLRHRAVEAAYAAHADDVYRLAYAVLRDRDDATEATQEAFVKAFERWDRYDPERPLRPWLHAIASRIALDQLRRRRVRALAIPALGRESPPGAAAYGGRDPGMTVPRRMAISEAFAALGPVPRAAVLLRHRYGYDYEEIGALLGLSVSNVGAVLTRARSALRGRLQDEATAHPKEREA